MESTCTLRGTLQSEEPMGTGLTVELQGSSVMAGAGSAPVDPTGSFQINGIPAGQYVLAVTGFNGRVIHREFVTVGPNFSEVVIRLPRSRKEDPGTGTVSVKRLAHKVPSKAKKEFKRAEEAHEKGDVQASIQHLARALEIDPAYMEAHNNLGSRYLQQNQFEAALTHFEKACDLDPGASIPQANASAALLLLKRNEDAERAARRALELDPSNTRARYALAVSLVEQQKEPAEAMEHLERVAAEIPRARVMMARLLARQGNPERAREELQKYLATAPSEEQPEVQAWLAQLQHRGD
ncbi:MAG: tetratricopeptide repeat protein [Bryobacterales bacterium]|nr:tetratricopeptide repeat protein [Bryobacterales bacterium]